MQQRKSWGNIYMLQLTINCQHCRRVWWPVADSFVRWSWTMDMLRADPTGSWPLLSMLSCDAIIKLQISASKGTPEQQYVHGAKLYHARHNCHCQLTQSFSQWCHAVDDINEQQSSWLIDSFMFGFIESNLQWGRGSWPSSLFEQIFEHLSWVHHKSMYVEADQWFWTTTEKHLHHQVRNLSWHRSNCCLQPKLLWHLQNLAF